MERSTKQMVELAKVSEIPEGGMIMKEHGGQQVMLAKIAGKVYAMNDICTHEGAPLNEGQLDGDGKSPYFLTCPWHEAHFDIRTGKVYQDTPWATDTETHKVRVKREDVYVAL